MSVLIRSQQNRPPVGSQLPLFNQRDVFLTSQERILPKLCRLRPNRAYRVVVGDAQKYPTNVQTTQINAAAVPGYKNIPCDLMIIVQKGYTLQPAAAECIDLTGFPLGSRITIINRGTIVGYGTKTGNYYALSSGPAYCRVFNHGTFGTTSGSTAFVFSGVLGQRNLS